MIIFSGTDSTSEYCRDLMLHMKYTECFNGLLVYKENIQLERAILI